MVPPHDRPTFHAVSSATPNSSIFGLPLSITSMASVTTAPSTQPPETEPKKLPSWSMTRFEPTGRGAEPQVSTTVASATPRPCRRQSSAALRMSSSRASMRKDPPAIHLKYGLPDAARQRPKYISAVLILRSRQRRRLEGGPSARQSLLPSFETVAARPPQDEDWSRRRLALRHPLQPRFGIGAAAGSVRQRPDKLGHGIEVVNGAELVHVRQHGADAFGLCLEAVEAQERVEPDQAPARTMQPVDLEGERVVAVALQPVGDQQHDGPLAEHAPAPIFVESMQRAGD